MPQVLGGRGIDRRRESEACGVGQVDGFGEGADHGDGGDRLRFTAYCDGEIGELGAAPIRAFLADLGQLSAATRKRTAIASFCRWAVRHDLLDANPMDRIDTIKVPKTLPRPAAAADIAKVLAAICSRRPRKDLPLDRPRDRVLFETAYVCGARASEVCGLYVEDLDLHLDDEHVRIHGKGGGVRTVLLDDRGHVALLKLYLARAGYTAGPLFRASINGRGGPLSYDAAHHRWQTYCVAARVEIDIHQLRHAHATELINAGVSIEAVRGRLGHASAETTQLYALLDDKVADAEIRAAHLAARWSSTAGLQFLVHVPAAGCSSVIGCAQLDDQGEIDGPALSRRGVGEPDTFGAGCGPARLGVLQAELGVRPSRIRIFAWLRSHAGDG
ncbi:tyrosine-type recombinase/integrase [Nonomuraea rubra]|uniref:Site-specific recombinase XerD n=1 Tax=Nonomuraea rubra TaxID=46180 RepID=A0A7X0U1A2_9ACTN|nr:tyrosine-type recombinase/integrase [Nonomuraea rubra]MBB6551219.1 site-specific recombinase XerD [Nonomuraea rubra]